MNDPHRWIDAYLDDALSQEESEALRAWLKAHPDHLRDFVEANRFDQQIRSAVAASHQRMAAVGFAGRDKAPMVDRRQNWNGGIWAWCNRRQLTGVVIVCAALMSIPLFRAWNARRNILHANVASIQGSVEIVRADRSVPATPGAGVLPGERLRTAIDGAAVLRLSDGSSIHLEASTDLAVPQSGSPRAFRVKTGAVRCAVSEQPPGQPLVFQTPHAELTVPGTDFDLVAAPVESRVRVEQGAVRWTDGGPGIEVIAGEASTADVRGVQAWVPVCDFDFATMTSLPSQLETVFCDSMSLHTTQRKIRPAPEGIRLTNGGLRFAPQRESFGVHGLIVSRWTSSLGGDVAIEVGLTAAARWALQLAVDGDSFEGYRIIFAAPKYPNGIAVDTLHPSGVTLLAQDPRALPEHGDHVLRVEKRGHQLRIWVDRELRIDTVIDHPLGAARKRTFALGQFGSGPLVRSLRVWKTVDKRAGQIVALLPSNADATEPFPFQK